MKKETTSIRLKQYMKMYNLRQVDILNKCRPFAEKYGSSISRSLLSHYVAGAFEPKQDKLTILSLGLNVSEAWLMGYDVPMERTQNENSIIVETDNLNDFNKRMAKYICGLFDKMSIHQITEVAEYAAFKSKEKVPLPDFIIKKREELDRIEQEKKEAKNHGKTE